MMLVMMLVVGYDVGAPGLSAWAWRRCRAAAGVIRRSNQALPAPLDKIQIQNSKYKIRSSSACRHNFNFSISFHEVEDIES